MNFTTYFRLIVKRGKNDALNIYVVCFMKFQKNLKLKIIAIPNVSEGLMIKWLHTQVSQMKIIQAYGIHLIKCMQVPQLVFFLLQIVRHFQKKYRVILNYQMDLFLWIKFVFFNTMTPDLSKKNESLFSSPLWYILLGWVCIFRKEFLKNSWQFLIPSAFADN